VCTDDSCDPYSGQCNNYEVSCDDFLLCTLDKCDVIEGCYHVPVHERCPGHPSDECYQAVCDASSGCGFTYVCTY
jgi:hypothetical protein